MEETATIIPVQFEKVVQAHTYSCLVLATEEKRIGIFSSPETGQAMQRYLAQSHSSRPLTHDLLHSIFRGFDISLKHITITDMQDTVFFARLFLSQKKEGCEHIVEIDARPSDCITLALIYQTPIYCARHVIEQAVPYSD